MKIAVIGLGKIGLPLAAQYASKGHDVVGVDVNAATVDAVNAAVEPFPGEAHLAEHLATSVPAGHLRATTDYGDAIPDADAVVVAVPLFVDEESRPDYSIMDAASASIGGHLSANTLVSFETTLPVGTTRDRLTPILEQRSSLVEGTDFHVVFSPERVLTGRVFQDLRRYPKLVGGLSPAGAARAVTFYEAVLDFDERPDLERPNGVWDLGSAEASELAKLAETTYRDVNIALANQFATFAESAGIDVYKVIEASNSQPYSHIHRPGISVGGHCIPVYPRLYLSNDPDAELVRTARATNARNPARLVEKLRVQMGGLDGATVAVLGVAYRPGVKESAFSGVFATVEALESFGADVRVTDPLFSDEEISSLGLDPVGADDVFDAVVIHTDHDVYRALRYADFPRARAVVDGRNFIDAGNWDPVPVIRLGVG